MEIARAWPHLAVEPRHGFEIVVEDVRLRRDDGLDRALLAQEIRHQHLDRCRGRGGTDRSDGLREMRRAAILEIIHREGYRLVERPFTVAEAKTAREAFLTSTTADLLPVVRIDGAPVGDGKPGPLSRKLREAYLLHAAAAA